MPFLNKAILIEILNKYGDDVAEKKPPAPKGFLSSLAFSTKTTLNAVADKFKKAAGKNTKEDSLQWYRKLKLLIIKACDEQNVETWAELIVKSGEAGYQTQNTSWLFGSQFSCCAFALRSYILNKVSTIYATIDKNKPLTEDQVFATRIKATLDKKVKEQLLFIVQQNNNINSNKPKNPEDYIKTQEHEDAKFEDSSEHMIIKRQRILCYLNAFDLLRNKKYQVFVPDKPRPLKLIMKELFPNFARVDLDSLYSEETRDLPLVFQPNYDAIFIRSKESDLQNDTDQNAISNFEDRIVKRNVTPSYTPILENLPERSFVPDLISMPDMQPFEEPQSDDKPSEEKPIADLEHHTSAPMTGEAKNVASASPPLQSIRRSSHHEVLSNLTAPSQPPESKIDDQSIPLPDEDDRDDFDSSRIERAKFVRGGVGAREIMPFGNQNEQKQKFRSR